MPEVHIKAVPVNGLVRFVQSELSSLQVQAVLSAFGADARYFTGHLLANDKVPLTIVNRFNRLAAEAKNSSVKEFGRRAFGARQE